MARRVGSADSLERRSTANRANVTPSITVPKNLQPNNTARSQAASQARYEGMGRTMAPSGTAVQLPTPVTDDTNKNFSQQIQYGDQTAAIPTPAEPDVSVETLTKTPEYLARERAIQNQLDLFTAGQATGRARFDEDYGRSLTELGYDPTAKTWDLGELLSSGQRATASGKAYNALRNDFAARGMLQSGAYQAQRGVVAQQLADQLKATEGGRTKFLEDQTAALTAQQQQAEAQRLAALDEARQAILNRFGMGG